MAKKVRIPYQLRKLTDNEELLDIDASSIGDMLLELESRFPGMQERLLDGRGEIRKNLLVHVNDEQMDMTNIRQAPLKDGDEVSITAAIAGG